MAELLQVAGQDPYIGAERRDTLAVPGGALSTVSPESRRIMADLERLRDNMRQEVAERRTETISRLSKVRDLPATFISVDSDVLVPAGVPAGAIQAIPFQTFNNVRITDFTVQAAGAPGFAITGMQIGRLNLFQNNGAIPADRFTPDANRPPIETPELKAGTQGVVTVQNLLGVAARFLAVFDAIDLSFSSPDCGR